MPMGKKNKCSNKNILRILFLQAENREKITFMGVLVMAQLLTNPSRNHEVSGSIPGLAQWVKDLALLCAVGVDRRSSLDLKLLWLWLWPAATALIQPLAWESPYAADAALKSKNNNNKTGAIIKKMKTLILIFGF